MDIQTILEQAKAAARQKDFATARTYVKAALQQDPRNLNAWMLAAHVVESRDDSVRCFQRVLQIDPANTYARQKLEQLQGAPPQPAVPAPEAPPAGSPAPGPQSPAPAVAPAAVNAQAAPPVRRAASRSTIGMGLIGLAVILFVLVCIGGIWLAVSSGGLATGAESGPTPTESQLFDVLYRNAQAATNRDVGAYMETIHPKSKGYANTEAALEILFAQFSLFYQYYDLSLIEVSSAEASIRYALVTRRVSGPAFQDNIIRGIVTLRPDNGVWKIYDQTIEDTEYIQ